MAEPETRTAIEAALDPAYELKRSRQWISGSGPLQQTWSYGATTDKANIRGAPQWVNMGTSTPQTICFNASDLTARQQGEQDG